ncbi:hypothetical protein V1282_002306 [Nitrobacteraceae bacterium AZCC 2146]
MAGLVPAIHDVLQERGCPAQGRAGRSQDALLLRGRLLSPVVPLQSTRSK